MKNIFYNIIIGLSIIGIVVSSFYVVLYEEERKAKQETMIYDLKDEISYIYDELNYINDRMYYMNVNLIGYYKIIQGKNETINELEQEIQDYKNIIKYKDKQFESNYSINMKPTYKDVTDFLEEDKTDELEWTKDFDCTQFAHMIIRNAKEQGIYGCIVTIDFNYKEAHDIVAFDTIDAGIVYFEPHNDKYVYMYENMDYASYLGHPEEVSMIVKKYDSCF